MSLIDIVVLLLSISCYFLFLLDYFLIKKSPFPLDKGQVVKVYDINDMLGLTVDCSVWISPGNRRYNGKNYVSFKHSSSKGSPRHSFLTFFSIFPRSCNVSVSCRWTFFRTHIYIRWHVLILRVSSCTCGRKLTAWNHCSVLESPSHCYRTCCWIFLVALMFHSKTQQQKKMVEVGYRKSKTKDKAEKKEEDEKEEEENNPTFIIIISIVYHCYDIVYFPVLEKCNRVSYILAHKAKTL